MRKEIVVGLHFYQPPRRAFHQAFSAIETDPQGIDWTNRADRECYRPLTEMGLLDLASYDINGVLFEELSRRSSTTYESLRTQRGENAIGTPWIHPILPDLSLADKQITIGAGVLHYERNYGTPPKVFWPPETAMDTETAEVLVDFGYEAFVCSPRQIQLIDGSEPDNIPTRITLPSNRSIIAIPFDGETSKSFAFGNKSNANNFTSQYVFPSIQRLITRNRSQLVTWTDAETFGHHAPFADLFLEHFLKVVLPANDIHPISINWLDKKNPKEGKIFERSAWSCLCGGLKRWSTDCACTGPDNSWKAPYYQAFRQLNDTVTTIAEDGLGKEYLEKMMNRFDEGFRNPGPPATTPEQSLIAAKVASLTGRTSCATFFGEPGTSGYINILFGLVAIQHLRDAGLTHLADQTETMFMKALHEVKDPSKTSGSMKDIAETLCNQKPTLIRS